MSLRIIIPLLNTRLEGCIPSRLTLPCKGNAEMSLPNCLLIVTAEVDSEVEAEWNRWYDEVHLPDALACPGVLGGRRYVTTGEVSESDRGQGRRSRTRLYTTVYELASPGAVTTPEFTAMRGWGRFVPHVRSQTRVVSGLS
jgi:hypothetical protein